MDASTDVAVAGLEWAVEGGVVRITLDRPDRRNALSQQLLTDLGAMLVKVADDASARVVVIAARGPVFCAGHDLGEMVGKCESDYAALFSLCSRVMLQLRMLPQPVIARVQGPAVAAGCQLVASCDLAVASGEATFATPGVKIGLFCTTPMVPLVRAIPPKGALEMLLTGAPISAERARELGLVNRVTHREGLDAAVNELVQAIIVSSPLAVRLGKTAFYDQLGLSEPDAYVKASATMTQNALRADAQEGISAFLQKRKPIWKGE
jgi:enoyl-CoA hydratase/carnithine racemase